MNGEINRPLHDWPGRCADCKALNCSWCGDCHACGYGRRPCIPTGGERK